MAIDRLNTLLSMKGGSDDSIMSLPISKLDQFPNSPFKIYDGKKKENLINSIKDNGIMFPIIVMPNMESRGHYTILSGANRVDAYKQLGHEEINAIVKTDITEEEAMLIVVETNLFNRSVDDMLPSELAKSLALRQKALKQQGKRKDLIETEESTSGTICQKSEDMYQILNEEYKLSERNIRNYIRLTYLCDDLLAFIDNNVIPFSAGVELSYLKKEEQSILFKLIKDNNYKVTIDIAKELKLLSGLNSETILEESQIKNAFVKLPKNSKNPKSSNFIKIPVKSIISYIKEEDLNNAQSIMIEALKLYYEMNS